jgi:hypothetical protein
LPVRSRRYDDSFWRELMARGGAERSAKDIEKLFS